MTKEESMNSLTILVVDDEAAIRQMMSTVLNLAGYEVVTASCAQTALPLIVDTLPDLILLDWMLPGISGIEFARRLKRDTRTQDIPIILLTAKSEEENKVQGLDAGADDYVTKPFSNRELVSRIRAVLRRTNALAAEERIDIEGLSLDAASQRISAHGQPLGFGPTEYRLMAFFMTHPERVYSREQLLDRVWGTNVYVDERTVDVHIRRLRKTLAPHGFDKFIQTVRGAGYRFSTLSQEG